MSWISVVSLLSNSSGAVQVENIALQITKSTFKNIKASVTSGVSCFSCLGFSISLSAFDDLYSPSSSGSCIYIDNNPLAGEELSILGTTFNKCVIGNYLGAAFYFDYADIPVDLIIAQSEFSNNYSSRSGTALYIGSAAHIKPTSVITDCVFKQNVDISDTLIEMNLGTTFTIKNSIFQGNVHKYSLIHIDLLLEKYLVVFDKCAFDNNTAEAILFIVGKSWQQHVLMKNTSFTNSKGFLTDIYTVSFTVIDSVFKGSDESMRFTESDVNMTSTKMSQILASEGVIELYEGSILQANNCLFTDNYISTGGVLRADTSCKITVKNSKFLYNTGNKGSALYLINTTLDNLLQDCEIAYNHALTDSTLYITLSSLTLVRVEIHSNTSKESAAIYVQNSDLWFQSSNTYNQTGDLGSLFVIVTSSIYMINSTLHDSQGLPVMMFGSSLEIANCRIWNIQAKLYSMITTQGENEISIESSQFDGLSSISSASLVSLIGGIFSMNSSRVSRFNSTALDIQSAKQFSITDSIFECKD